MTDIPNLYRVMLQVSDLDKVTNFYFDDPFENGLCFVAEETIFTGR